MGSMLAANRLGLVHRQGTRRGRASTPIHPADKANNHQIKPRTGIHKLMLFLTRPVSAQASGETTPRAPSDRGSPG